jgi:hypothetical protein
MSDTYEVISNVGATHRRGEKKKKEQSETREERKAREEAAIRTVRMQYKGLRVHFHNGPKSRKVSEAHNSIAADALNADKKSITVMKRLWKADETEIKAMSKIYSEIRSLIKDPFLTLPTTKEGLRLVRRSKLSEVKLRLEELQKKLAAQAVVLREALPGIIERERRRSPGVFNAEVYYSFNPVRDCYIEYEFPLVTEDKELAEIDESIYREELERCNKALLSAVRKCEEEMMGSLYESLKNATSRLEVDEAGNPKRFQASTVTRLFKELEVVTMQLEENKIGGSGLKAVTTELKKMLRGQQADTLPDAIRSSANYRQNFAQHCDTIANQLLDSATPGQRRRLLLRPVAKKE